ncbi:uncharacterized protein A4U43_C01F25250 [Asparagus officinalis]|uniref:Uncharacterized protein n=1 Tax=Asparagus officinalis TaxID=4686 RepID=A0A5P1FUJ0_ASPOF|nr:uncharacterized protein A4U43_C01F25250 [Asparagus officinalis]
MSLLAGEVFHFTFEVQETDDAILNELLEETSSIAHIEQDNELIDDLHDESCEDCRLDDMLMDINGHECSGSSSTGLMMSVDEEFGWEEEMGAWWTDEDERVIMCRLDHNDCQEFHCGESCMEQWYAPLWQ